MHIAPDPGVLIRRSLTEERHGVHLDHFGGKGFHAVLLSFCGTLTSK